jgi:hypothetical protein
MSFKLESSMQITYFLNVKKLVLEEIIWRVLSSWRAGSVIGWDTMLEAGRSRIQFPIR